MRREMQEIRVRLLAQADKPYAAFQLALMPGVSPERVIGVRMPLLRARAWELRGTDAARSFMDELPHAYVEEDNLHALLIGEIRDFDKACEAIECFLPFVSNWATCDSLRPKAFRGEKVRLLLKIRSWLSDAHPYTIRFGMEMLMVHFLGENLVPETMQWVADVRSDHYYVRMMAAWYFATALALNYDEALAVVRENSLDAWTHNKAIEKARESRRVSQENKAFLLTLRR